MYIIIIKCNNDFESRHQGCVLTFLYVFFIYILKIRSFSGFSDYLSVGSSPPPPPLYSVCNLITDHLMVLFQVSCSGFLHYSPGIIQNCFPSCKRLVYSVQIDTVFVHDLPPSYSCAF